jgi:exonuclease SbcC
MRILAIRGANLASLAAPFEVSLAEGPLAGAGLFAIVGETGAGKSTLLDTICLALYGKCPRVVAAGDAAEVPDVDRLAGGDPRTVLRRGASYGFAQVDFVATDGERYQATWTVRRARNKSTGRLQQPERSLTRLVDNQGVATGLEQTRVEIEKRIGLTFDQFRRAVLLAQGDFDAFLRADDKDRADLLEKVTGTEIYGRVSRYVHDATRERARTVDNLRQRLADVGGLDADVRLTLEDELKKAGESVSVTRAARDVLQGDLNAASKALGAREALEAARQQMQEAELAWKDAEPDRHKLQIIAAVDQLAPTLRAEARERTTLQAALLDGEEASAALGLALEADVTLKANAVAAAASHAAEEALFKKFGPLWTQAGQLDGRLTDAETNCATAEAAATLAETQFGAAETALQQIGDRLAQLAKRATETTELRKTLPDLSAFADRVEDVASDFRACVSASAERLAARTALEDHQTTATLLNEADVQAAAALVSAEAAASEAEKGWRSASNEIAGVDQEGMEATASSLEVVVRELRTCAQAVSSFGESSDRQRVGDELLATSAARVTELIGLRASLETKRSGFEGEMRAAIRFRVLADEAAEATASRLRESLQPDAPCAVCGSVEHPFAGNHEAAGHLAATQRAEIQGIAHEQERAEQELENARNDIDRERETSNEIAASVKSARDSIASAVKTWTTSRALALEAALAAGLDIFLPITPDVGDVPDAIDRAIEEADRRQQALRAQLASLRQKRVLIDKAVLTLRSSEETAREARSRAAAARQALSQSQLSGTGLAAVLRNTERQTAEASARVETVAKAAGLKAEDIEANASLAAEKVSQALARWNELEEALKAVDEQTATEKTNQVGATATRDGKREVVQTARRQHSDQVASRDRLKEERAALLGGEPTATHRTRYNDSRLAAQIANRDAQERLAEVQVALGRAAARASASKDAKSASEVRLSQLVSEADAALLEAGLDRALAIEILEVPEDARRNLEASVQALRDLRDACQVRMELRLKEAGTANAAVPVETSIPELEAALLIAIDAFEAAIKIEAEKASVLRGDDARRQAADDLRDAFDAAEVEHKVHASVSEAIGSADGSRFRRIAQRITLRALVDSANKQLEVLGPRYRLALTSDEGLGILAVDREMGDELRSTRSLSGGERFLVSLALALALSNIEGRGTFVETLFIDEGFGSLDPTRLDLVVDALEALQSAGRQVGVITHVPGMIDRIAVQIRVESEGGGKSRVVVDAR